jgi:P pilus assembly chaperone PapD
MKKLLLFTTLHLITPTLFALNITPMFKELSPKGKDTIATFRIWNKTDRREAVKTYMFVRQYDDSGKEIQGASTDDFKLHPAQAVLFSQKDKDENKGANEKILRIEYKGDKEITVEKAYRLITEQVPVKLDRNNKTSGQVYMLSRYSCAIYVTPAGAKSNITTAEAKIESEKGMLKFKNDGNKRGTLSSLKISLEGDGDKGKLSRELTKEELKNVLNETILAKSERKFSFDLPKDFKTAKNIKINLSL